MVFCGTATTRRNGICSRNMDGSGGHVCADGAHGPLAIHVWAGSFVANTPAGTPLGGEAFPRRPIINTQQCGNERPRSLSIVRGYERDVVMIHGPCTARPLLSGGTARLRLCAPSALDRNRIVQTHQNPARHEKSATARVLSKSMDERRASPASCLLVVLSTVWGRGHRTRKRMSSRGATGSPSSVAYLPNTGGRKVGDAIAPPPPVYSYGQRR